MTRTAHEVLDDPADDVARKPGGGCTTALLSLLTLGFLAWAALPIVELDVERYTVALTALTQYAVIAGAVLVLLGLLLRRWLNVLFALLATVALVYTVAPRVIPDPVVAEGEALRVLSVNTYFGGADAAKIVEEVRNRGVDVLSLQELTPEMVTELERAGLFAELPNRVLQAGPKADGTGIVSRYPLRELSLVPTTTLAQPSALVDVPTGRDVEFVAVHPIYPMGADTTPVWQRDLVALPEPSLTGQPRVMAGDFNATLDHTRLKDLIGRGYVDAAGALGEGLTPTWPSGWTAPPVTIDHVLSSGGVLPEDYEVVDIPGSDHRAVFTTLRVAG
ncbi:endonuclease/exonuclease/phosphatase family protein [Saccharopolyspora mangrovi]|uniref:Endonuclease/exonuclease/phosphatase family protein n=1 Tax=Saccharopolyspora mangrovi TaxID=3082379 RepID=A0ABU6ACV5_9PSEU|nr:endonuclease/exonuclease/phosphatase family protein [Saccharopolyspora sp. S2-29]MEB3369381.1 endonuclease/exonuclease/phosphatase family protein [Saccharopolyspora sp. S2-29]